MNVVNEVLGTAERFQELLDLDIEGPVSMLHLLKFREQAVYEDGRASTLTGAEAYDLYLRDLADRVESAGGQVALSKRTQCLVLGQVQDPWDAVVVVDYPSKETFVDVVTAPESLKAGIHRRAGLDGQLLIALGGSHGG